MTSLWYRLQTVTLRSQGVVHDALEDRVHVAEACRLAFRNEGPSIKSVSERTDFALDPVALSVPRIREQLQDLQKK